MARTRRNRRKDPPPKGILKVSNEILLEIANLLPIPDLRRLGEVNRRLCWFIEDYLSRYRYSFGLFTLPNELILEIVQHLGREERCSRLARASQRILRAYHGRYSFAVMCGATEAVYFILQLGET